MSESNNQNNPACQPQAGLDPDRRQRQQQLHRRLVRALRDARAGRHRARSATATRSASSSSSSAWRVAPAAPSARLARRSRRALRGGSARLPVVPLIPPGCIAGRVRRALARGLGSTGGPLRLARVGVAAARRGGRRAALPSGRDRMYACGRSRRPHASPRTGWRPARVDRRQDAARSARRAADRPDGPPLRGPAGAPVPLLDGPRGDRPLVPRADRRLDRPEHAEHAHLPRPAHLVGRDGARERSPLRLPLAVAAGRVVGDDRVGDARARRLRLPA